jgi:hypothetical protein
MELNIDWFESLDQLEKAVYRSLSGVVGKKHKRESNRLASFILSKSIIKQISELEDQLKTGDHLKITFEISVEKGIVTGISDLIISVYECLSSEKLSNIKLKQDSLTNFVTLEDP